jgi:hypothetical protein
MGKQELLLAGIFAFEVITLLLIFISVKREK